MNLRRDAFLRRFTDRTLIVHAGLASDWLDELLKTGGGAGHFRIDARRLPQSRPSPVEWVVQEHVLPLGFPLPLLLRVAPDRILARHLQRHAGVCHPSDIPWMLDDIRERGRVHAALYAEGCGFRVERGIPPDDNAITLPDGLTL